MPIATVRSAKINYEVFGATGPWFAFVTGGRRGYAEFVPLAQKLAAAGCRVMQHWLDIFLSGPREPVMGLTDAQLGSIKVPTLIVPGNDKTHASVNGLAAHKLIPGSQLFELPITDQDEPVLPFSAWAGHEPALVRTFMAFMGRVAARAPLRAARLTHMAHHIKTETMMKTLATLLGSLLCTLPGSLLMLAATAVSAQTWPSKTIRLVEPAGPGSAVDVFARRLAPRLAEVLGQSVVIDNRAGANSAIGAREVARSPADGHTWLHANINNSLNDLLSSDACCRLGDALVPVTRLTTTPLVMVVHPSVPANNLREYIALAKAQPQLLTFASGGTGALTQLLGEKIKFAAGITMREIPYKAIGAELPDLLAGHVSTAYLAPVVVAQHIRSGKLRAIGVAAQKRFGFLPDVPTIAEGGLAGIDASGWNGLFVPAGTPRDIILRLQTETAKILASPAMKAEALAQGYEYGGESPEEFLAFIRAESARWGRVIKEANIKLE